MEKLPNRYKGCSMQWRILKVLLLCVVSTCLGQQGNPVVEAINH